MRLYQLALLQLVALGSADAGSGDAGSGSVPRFILNQSLATSTCSGAFNTPCAITNVHEIVDALVVALANSATPSAVLAQVNEGAEPYSPCVPAR